MCVCVWQVTAIYAIVAVNLFREAAPDNFNGFTIAFFSLFQTMSGDAWSEHCRDLMAASGQHVLAALFYVSFILVVGFT